MEIRYQGNGQTKTKPHMSQCKYTTMTQMCWCLRVSGGVVANLTWRFYLQVSSLFYKMCCCIHSDFTPSEDVEDFFKEVDRKTAEELLMDKQCGTFIIRPSKCHLATLSLVQDRKVFHLNVRRREDGLVALGNEKENEKCFRDVNSLINYYISNYLVLYSRGEKTLTLLLPYRDKSV